MENKDKYYIPDISEFHVGFECESNYVLFQKGNKGDIWNKLILDKDNISYMLDAYIQDAYDTEFRVKYLDDEDIESLEFKIDMFYNGIDFRFIYKDKKEIQLEFSKRHNEVNIIKERQCVFRGIINNKSELKKLLKQLNIN